MHDMSTALSYRIVGEGPPLLLVHGWGVTFPLWEQLEAQLAREASLVEVELPGLGSSPPASGDFVDAAVAGLRELRRRLGIDRWTVLGYSAGARVVSRYVREDAAHVVGVAYLCPLLPLGGYLAFEAVRRTVGRVSARPQLFFVTGWRLHWLMRVLAFNTVRSVPVDPWYRALISQPLDGLVAQFDDMFDREWAAAPPGVPAMRIWGRRDRLTVRPRPLGIQDRIIDAGHMAPLNAAPAVAAALRPFLRALAAPGPSSASGPAAPDEMTVTEPQRPGRARADIPGPRGLPLIGNGLQLARDPLGFLTCAGREHGGLARVTLPGQTAYLVTDPDLIEVVLSTGSEHFAKSPGNISDRRGQGRSARRDARTANDDLMTWLLNFPADREVFLPEEEAGHSLRQDRQQMGAAFATSRIASYADVMVEYAERVGGRWRDGQALDIHREMTRLSLAIVARTLFGTDALDRADAVAGAFVTCFEQIVHQLKNPIRVPMAVPMPRHLRIRRAVRNIGVFLDDVHRERQAVGPHGDLLDLLLADDGGHGRADGPAAGSNRWRHQALIAFAAGYETTAVNLTWTWYLLAAHPHVDARLHEELARVLGSRPPTASDYPRLPYTEAVVKEALRLYPPVWLVGPRTARYDLRLGPYALRAGSVALVSPWVTHRDPRLYPDPETFDPERWLDERAAGIPKYAYLPFSAGPRLCIGHRYAMMEAVMVLAYLAPRHRMLRMAADPPRPRGLVTLQPPRGLQLFVTQR